MKPAAVHKNNLNGTDCRSNWGRQNFASSEDWKDVTCRSCLRLYRLTCERNRYLYQRWVDHGRLPPAIINDLERARERDMPTTLKEAADRASYWAVRRDWTEQFLEEK